MQYAELKPGLPAHLFTAPPSASLEHEQMRPRSRSSANVANDEFGSDEIDDQDLVKVGEQRLEIFQLRSIDVIPVEGQDFQDIDDVLPTNQSKSVKEEPENKSRLEQPNWAPEKLDNGKWACNHKCKDKAV